MILKKIYTFIIIIRCHVALVGEEEYLCHEDIFNFGGWIKDGREEHIVNILIR